MVKGEKFQKLVLFGAMCVGALSCAEGYLQWREFVGRVHTAERQLASLKQEVETLRIQVDVTPRPASVALSPIAATAPQSLVLPIPEPMRLPAPVQERPRKPVNHADVAQVAASDQAVKADAAPDDGRVILMSDLKEVKPSTPASGVIQQVVATPTVDVKLWAKR